MSILNLSGVQSTSGISGLLYVGTVTASQTYTGVSVPAPAGTAVTETVNIPFTSNKVLSIINFNTSGTGASSIDNYSWPLTSFASFNVASIGYYFTVATQSATSGRNVIITFINNLNNATVNIPTVTFNFTAYMYSYPF